MSSFSSPLRISTNLLAMDSKTLLNSPQTPETDMSVPSTPESCSVPLKPGCLCKLSAKSSDTCQTIDSIFVRLDEAELRVEQTPRRDAKTSAFAQFVNGLKLKAHLKGVPSKKHQDRAKQSHRKALTEKKKSPSREGESQVSPKWDVSSFLAKTSSILPIREDSTIEKDIRRTFQDNPFFREKTTQDLLLKLLRYVAEISTEGYVQGMNFWVAEIAQHTTNKMYCVRMIDFLWIKLDMQNLYAMRSFENHMDLTKKLLREASPRLWKFLDREIETDLKLVLLDWLFCLGFTKVPSVFSAIFLENLVAKGWYYFYRVLISYFLHFEAMHSTKMDHRVDEELKFDYNILVKDHFKNPETEWGTILNRSRVLKIDDDLIEKVLVWNRDRVFERINLKEKH